MAKSSSSTVTSRFPTSLGIQPTALWIKSLVPEQLSDDLERVGEISVPDKPVGRQEADSPLPDLSAFFPARLILLLGGGGFAEAEVELESVKPGDFRIDALGLEFGRQAFVL